MERYIHGDCVCEVKNLDTKVDLILTSPPYDTLRDYEKGYNFDFKALSNNMYDKLKNGGVLVWVVADQTQNFSESLTSFEQVLYFTKKVGFKLLDTMIYHKPNGAPMYPNAMRYRQAHEYMFVFVKGNKPNTFNPYKIKKKAKDKTGSSASFRKSNGELKNKIIKNTSNKKYKSCSNLWTISHGHGSTKDNLAFEHPASFPEELAIRHIFTWTNKGDYVLDPMCGSGTTLKSSKYMGRHSIGIDISEKYLEISKKRCNLVEFDEYQMNKNNKKNHKYW